MRQAPAAVAWHACRVSYMNIMYDGPRVCLIELVAKKMYQGTYLYMWNPHLDAYLLPCNLSSLQERSQPKLYMIPAWSRQ
jgi:hypothetical protein